MKPRKSCDACYMRKTKCDLAQEKSKAKNKGFSIDNVCCTFCQSLKIKCKVSLTKSDKLVKTNVPSPFNKHKKGKRIRALLEESGDADIEEEEPLTNHLVSINGKHTSLPLFKLQSAGKKEGITSVGFTSWAMDISKANENTTNNKRPLRDDEGSLCRLLNVRGLNKARLDACFDGYFKTMERWIVLSQGREGFLKRVDLFIRQSHGLLTQEEEDEIRKKADKGPQYGPISEILLLAVAARGSTHSPYPQLFEPLVERFTDVIHSGDTLTDAGLDGVEAVVIMHEAFFRALYPRAKNGESSTCLQMDPLGKGFPMVLCLFQKVNEYSSPICRKDPDRARRLFWIVFCTDALRSASACRMYRLQESDIGWPYPVPANKHPFYHISDIARLMCRGLFSPRAKCDGNDDQTVLEISRRLADWPKDIKLPLDELLKYSEDSPLPPGADLIDTSFVTVIWLRLSLSLWTGVQGKNGNPLLPSTLEHIERATLVNAQRFELLANICIKYELVECGSTLIISSLTAWFLYLMRDMDKGDGVQTHKPVQLDDEEPNRYRMAQTMIDGIRSAKQTKGTTALADSLQVMFTGKKGGRENDFHPDKNAKVSEQYNRFPNVRRKRKNSALAQRRSSRSLSSSGNFPSEEEQRQGAFSSSDSPTTTVTPTQTGLYDSTSTSGTRPNQTNHFDPSELPTFIQPIPMHASNAAAAASHSMALMNQTPSQMLSSEVLAWDPDLLAFLDASLGQDQF